MFGIITFQTWLPPDKKHLKVENVIQPILGSTSGERATGDDSADKVYRVVNCKPDASK